RLDPGRAVRAARRQLLPARRGRRLPHLFHLRSRYRAARRRVLHPGHHGPRPPGGMGGAEGPCRERSSGDPGLRRVGSDVLLTTAALASVTLIATATLAGAWLGRRSHRLPRLSLACAAVLLLAVIVADLLPDIWNHLSATGSPWWPAAGALGAGFLATDGLVRRGCACGTGPAGGRATAAALGLHRAIEGAALAVAGSVAVIAALVVHAASEGLALTALLRGERRGTAATLLAITCLSPAAGAA